MRSYRENLLLGWPICSVSRQRIWQDYWGDCGWAQSKPTWFYITLEIPKRIDNKIGISQLTNLQKWRVLRGETDFFKVVVSQLNCGFFILDLQSILSRIRAITFFETILYRFSCGVKILDWHFILLLAH